MTYYVCSDRIDGKETSYINAIIKELEAKGKDAVNSGVGPNKEGVRNNTPAGNTVIFLVGGGAAGCTLASFVKSAEGHDYAHTIFAYAGWCGNPAVTEARARTDKLVREHDCNFYQPWMPSYYEGHTIFTFCKKYSKYVSVCCSDESAEDLGKKIASGKCGEGDDSEEGDSSATTIKEAIKEVLSIWDGEVECKTINDTMYINKVPNPAAGEPLLLYEGMNVLDDSVTITDINPDTVNFLTVHWEGGEDIVLRDEKLITRFGEKPLELDAVKKIQVLEEESDSEDSTTTTDVTADTANLEPENTSDDATSVEDTSSDVESSSQKWVTKEVPVETYEEAKNFADLEWNKIRRDDGHSIECKVTSGSEWAYGRWVKVYLPRFNEDCYMYIKSLSSSESDSGWETNLTLVDYPPSFGEPKDEEEDNEEDSEDTEEDADEESTGEVAV